MDELYLLVMVSDTVSDSANMELKPWRKKVIHGRRFSIGTTRERGFTTPGRLEG